MTCHCGEPFGICWATGKPCTETFVYGPENEVIFKVPKKETKKQ
jgi:hypothetical protein